MKPRSMLRSSGMWQCKKVLGVSTATSCESQLPLKAAPAASPGRHACEVTWTLYASRAPPLTTTSPSPCKSAHSTWKSMTPTKSGRCSSPTWDGTRTTLRWPKAAINLHPQPRRRNDQEMQRPWRDHRPMTPSQDCDYTQYVAHLDHVANVSCTRTRMQMQRETWGELCTVKHGIGNGLCMALWRSTLMVQRVCRTL